METAGRTGATPPNVIVLCMDQWDAHMDLPEGLRLPAMETMERRGVTFEKQYCTVPMCTASRAAMWTGVHAKNAGLWDNLNFSWIRELSPDVPTLGHMLRELGYYTAFKGKWHLSEVPLSEDALERYGFADFQAWGEMFGTPLQGAMLDGTVAFELHPDIAVVAHHRHARARRGGLHGAVVAHRVERSARALHRDVAVM